MDPVTDDWRESGVGFVTGGTQTKQGDTNEETWTLLPDGSVVTLNINGTSRAEKYIPATDTWVSASAPPQVLALMSLVDTTVNPPVSRSISEIGPALVLPDGRLFAVGATGHTGLYTPPANAADPGTWTAGPDFPVDTSTNNFNSPNATCRRRSTRQVFCCPVARSYALQAIPYSKEPRSGRIRCGYMCSTPELIV